MAGKSPSTQEHSSGLSKRQTDLLREVNRVTDEMVTQVARIRTLMVQRVLATDTDTAAFRLASRVEVPGCLLQLQQLAEEMVKFTECEAGQVAEVPHQELTTTRSPERPPPVRVSDSFGD